MGCSVGDTECSDHEPSHEERITSGFWLGQTEVTQAAFQRVTGGNPGKHKGDQLPVETVSWNEAFNYCRTIGGRLPTEAEWEYAARAGSTSARYGEPDTVSWHLGNSDHTTHPVALKQPNAFALYDMLGNVWEWVEDTYRGTTSKVARGGSGNDIGLQFLRASSIVWAPPTFRSEFTGFRCEWDFH
jgi:formylglycine-generating enzyme required for sulfatase activity